MKQLSPEASKRLWPVHCCSSFTSTWAANTRVAPVARRLWFVLLGSCPSPHMALTILLGVLRPIRCLLCHGSSLSGVLSLRLSGDPQGMQTGSLIGLLDPEADKCRALLASLGVLVPRPSNVRHGRLFSPCTTTHCEDNWKSNVPTGDN